MKVQQLTPQLNNRKQNSKDSDGNVRFTGAADWPTLALRFLDTNQAIGANSVDLCSMVIPRTFYDMKQRGPEAGLETARRESAGTINHSLVGAYGTLGGMLVASMINHRYGVRLDKIYADNNTTDILARDFHHILKDSKPDPIRALSDKIAENIKVYNTDINPTTGWVDLPKDTQKLVSDKYYEFLSNSRMERLDKDSKKYLTNIITAATGGEKTVKLQGFNKVATGSAETIIENSANLSKTFLKDSVKKIFEEAKDLDGNAFVKAVKKMNIQRSAIGLGIAAAIGMSIQPLNKYLTFKKTGKTGFVGVPGREEDKTTKFKIIKGITGLVFGLGALATITTKPKEFMSKIQFKGMMPTINQLKFVYGLTIMSRLWSARDKDELRESSVKDTLGFFNLLVLGALVTKYTAKALDKTKALFNQLPKGQKGGGFFNATLKTRDEVLLSTLKKHGIDTIKDGKAIPVSQLLKKVTELPKNVQDTLNSQLRTLNISQFVGYLYSGLVLGLGVPALNKNMTEKSDAKFKAKFAAEQAKNNPVAKENTTAKSELPFLANPVLDDMQKTFIHKHM